MDQLIFLNREILHVVDGILERSSVRPIIIIQGDHGWAPRRGRRRRRMISRMSILNAYYVPDEIRRDLYAGITPVNTFRLLLSRQFDVDLDLLPDRNYHTAGDESREVTGRLARVGN